MESKSLASQVRWSKYMVFGAILITLIFYGCKFGWNHGWGMLSSDKAEWGQFGDFFGGVLNPLISFGAFYWLATSILLQKAELSETREALRATQDAQQQHADTALIAAKMQRENVRLTLVAGKLGTLRARQNALLERQADRSPGGAYFDEKGNHTQITLALEKLQSQIEMLEFEEAQVFGLLAQQGNELRKEVARGYASN